MPDTILSNQPFDLTFHPTEPVLYASLLTGEIKSFRYNEGSSAESSGEHGDGSGSGSGKGLKQGGADAGREELEPGSMVEGWTVRPSHRCIRGLTFLSSPSTSTSTSTSPNSATSPTSLLWACGKDASLYALDPSTGAIVQERKEAHPGAINRIEGCFEGLFVSGGDDGLIKLWDSRTPRAVREYPHHWEYISDFEFLEEKRQLLTTSGDGTLSVIDIRSNKAEPLAVSDDQEDELLSVCSIKGGSKVVVGSQLGMLSVFERSKGWADSVDRIPGHPSSVETIVALTPDIVATGSEDSMIRVMQIHPNKFLGVIATHGEFPIERMKLDRNGRFIGSVSHDECIKLTDVQDLFEDSDDEEDGEGEGEGEGEGGEGAMDMGGEVAGSDSDDSDDQESGDDDGSDTEGRAVAATKVDEDGDTAMESADSDAEEDARDERRMRKEEKKQQRKREALRMKDMGKKGDEKMMGGKNDEGNFFDDL